MNAFTRFAHDAKKFLKPKNLKAKLRARGKVFPIVSYVLICLWVLVFAYLVIWAIIASLKADYDFFYNTAGWPKLGFHFDNYAKAFQAVAVRVIRNGKIVRVGYFELIFNSLLMCVGVPFFALLDVAACSYITSKYRHFKFTRAIFAIVIFINYVPLSASLASNIRLQKALGLYDTIWGQWIVASGGFGAYFLIYYATFKSLSWTYAEAAFVDGASHFRVFFQIMLPMTKSTFFALFITHFIGAWTDYQTALIYLPTHPTLGLAAWSFQFDTGTETTKIPVKLAGMLGMTLPLLVLFTCFHKKLMGSMTVGGLKG